MQVYQDQQVRWSATFTNLTKRCERHFHILLMNTWGVTLVPQVLMVWMVTQVQEVNLVHQMISFTTINSANDLCLYPSS